MAQQDASAAIQNTLQRLHSQPNLPPEVEFKFVKSKLHRLGSHLDKFSNSISELTKAREIAYNVEDAMDDAIMAAQKRWRKLGNMFFFFFSQATATKEINQLVEKQAQDIELLTTSIASDEDAMAEEQEDTAESPAEEEEEQLFVLSLSAFPAGVEVSPRQIWVAEEQDTAEIPAGKDLFVLSLSSFPAEVEISARRLIQIWVAEGLQGPQGRPVTEEEGREQIERLLQRGFITGPKRGTCGDLKAFTIDKVKLEMCRNAAEKEQFLHVVEMIHNKGENEESVNKVEAPRLAIHNRSTSQPLTENDLRRISDLSKVRSLQIHCAPSAAVNKTPLYHGIPDGVKKKFGSLRVLDLGCLPVESVPDWIGKLMHLKYLRLNAPGATRIPASICKLPSLQTLDLKETIRVKAVPVAIWKMKKNLRHLHLGGAAAFPPPRMVNHYDALENLQSLCGVRPDKELKRLMVRAKFPHVTRLRLQCTSKKESPEFLSFLNSLDHLYHLRSLTLGGPIEDLPSDWNAFPSSLMKMTLSKTRIPAGICVKTLENLPNLRYLKLMEDSVTGTKMNCAGGGFPALRLLTMEGLKDLQCWRVEKGAMRLLKKVEVTRCEKLGRVEAETPSKELGDTLRELHRNCNSIELYGC